MPWAELSHLQLLQAHGIFQLGVHLKFSTDWLFSKSFTDVHNLRRAGCDHEVAFGGVKQVGVILCADPLQVISVDTIYPLNHSSIGTMLQCSQKSFMGGT